MYIRFIKQLSSIVALLLLIVGSSPAYADASSITLSANKSTVASGGSVVVSIYMNGGGSAIDAVEADLNYSASKLQYVGFSATGSAFEISAQHDSASDGLATVARGTTSPVSGAGLIGAVTFKALSSSGSATVSVASSSALASAGASVPYVTRDVTINFGAAAVSSSAAAPAVPAAPKDTTPPVIAAVKATSVTPFGATITWTTNEASDSAVDYGLDTNYGLGASSTTAVTSHSVALNSGFLSPQLLIHYRVKSTDGAGNVAVGQDQTLELPGVMVTVVVRGPDGQPQPGAQVTLDGATGTTDNHGQVTLPSSLGNKKVTTVYQGVTVQKAITVAKSSKPLPPVQLDLSRKPTNRWMLATVGLAVLVLTLLGIDAVLFGSHFFARLAGLHTKHPAPAVVKPRHAFRLPHFKRPHRSPRVSSISTQTPTPSADQAAPPPPVAQPLSPPSVAVAPRPEPPTPKPMEDVKLDPMRTVQELMGGPPALSEQKPDVSQSPPVPEPRPPQPAIEHFAPKPAAPLVTDLKPTETPAAPAPVATTIPVMELVSSPSSPAVSTAPPLASAVLPETQAAKVAKRLKKPAAKKAKSVTRKKSAKAKK